ncbi:MAG: site-specific integrase [Acidobacteria bacterium]|nr:site-specific integrase [Acidobacteriota bacterium]
MNAVQEGVTVGDLCDGLLAQIQTNPQRYKDQLNPPQRLGAIKKQFGNRSAAGLKAFEVSDWLSSLKVAPATSNRYKAMFSAVYKYGKNRSLVTVNPVRDVEPEPVSNGVIRYLTPAEEKRLREVLQQDVDACGPRNPQRRKRMLHRIYEFEVALKTGMRKGEQYGLTWDDVDFHAKEILLRNTKNGASRTVHMIPNVIVAMKALQKMKLGRKDRSEDRPNQSPDNSAFGIGDNKNWWLSALRRAKIKNLRWHDLRHTFCSRLAQQGVSLKVIQEAAGHKTIQMTARYAHLDKTTLVNALNVLND